MNRQRRCSHLRFLVPVVMVWVLVACRTAKVVEEATPRSDQIATLQPTETPTPTVTATPTSPPSPSPTATLSPTPTSEPPEVAPLAGLVYGTGGGLWRVDVDGQPVLLTERSDVLLSPEALDSPGGGLALFLQGKPGEDHADVWTVDLTTGEERNLTREVDRIECCPQWWPARPEVILFGSWLLGDELGPSSGFLTAVRADGSEYRVLDEGSASNVLPAPSPDGQTIAYDRGGTAWLYRWDVGPEPFNPEAYGLPVHRAGSPAWSPDGRQLAWVVGGYFEEEWQIGVGVFDLEARTSRLLHPYEPVGMGGWPGPPTWSPDGQWLGYVVWPAVEPAEGGVWVFHTDGEEEHFLGPGGVPVWSPGGERLAFRSESVVWLVEIGSWRLQQADLPAVSQVVDWVAAGR